MDEQVKEGTENVESNSSMTLGSNSDSEQSIESKTKLKLSHPDAFIDEVEEHPDEDPDASLLGFDPNIDNELSSLDADFANLDITIESLDLSGNSDLDVPLSLSERIQRLKQRLKKKSAELILKFYFGVKHFGTWLGSEAPRILVRVLFRILNQVKNIFVLFGEWSVKRKILFTLTLLGLGALLSVYIFVIKNRVLEEEQFQFLGSMAELAKSSFQFEAEGLLEPFYDSPRVKAFYFQIKPVVVNLKREGDFNKNPMGFFEFAVQGSSGDVLVELKQRESEVLDLIQRVAENHTYEALDTVDGKEALKEDILKELNKKLLEGVVRRVEIRNFFIKP